MKISFYFPCCIARRLDVMFMRANRKGSCLVLGVIICALLFLTVFVIFVRNALLESSVICSTDDIINKSLTGLVSY